MSDDKVDGMSSVGRAYSNAAGLIHSTKMADINDNGAQTVAVLEGIFDMLAQVALELERLNDRAD